MRGPDRPAAERDPVTATLERDDWDLPMKSATNRSAGARRSGRGADLHQAAMVHHRDPVRHRQRLALVVRHVDRGDAERACRRRSSTCMRSRSFLSSATAARPSAGCADRRRSRVPGRHAAAGRRRAGGCADRRSPPARPARARCDALAPPPPRLTPRSRSGKATFCEDAHVWEQRVVLEDDADVAPVRRHA